MKKAIIFYESRTGTTRKLGENIGQYLEDNGISSEIRPTDEINDLDLSAFEYFFLGCWTSGFMLFFQRPGRNWVKFAGRLPVMDSERTVLFTTYKIRTGSMFRNMKKYLDFREGLDGLLEIASRDGSLPDTCREKLVRFIAP